jgi:hypothetical protein
MTQKGSLSRLFDFLAQNELYSIEKHEIFSTQFSVLRRSLRLMISLLREDGDEEGCLLSDRLRTLLSRWLTTPVEFDDSILESLEAIGLGAGFETRWGRKIGTAYGTACTAAQKLVGASNPLRNRLEDIIEELQREGVELRIYCHRSALSEFQSLHGVADILGTENEIFLHTPREYRESKTFDVLVKIGPLRSRGWGAVPDAVLTAPRFKRMVHIVWAGCQNEPDFGYDPVNVSLETEGAAGSKTTEANYSMTWKTTTTQAGDDPAETELAADEDDFRILSELGRAVDMRRCVLVEFGDRQAVLYPPRAEVLSFDPAAAADHFIDLRLPIDGLSEGMFVIDVIFHESGTDGLPAEDGKYSRIWKQYLIDKMLFDADFAAKLRADGIDLIHLEQSLTHWSKSATSVVHAPQGRKHFEILIRNLDIDYSKHTSDFSKKIPWIMAAWHEVTKSRGAAIQTGMNEQRAADDLVIEIIKSRLDEIIKQAVSKDNFHLTVSSGDDLPGIIAFHKIVAIEEGFLAPEGNLRTISDLEDIEQWRE